MEIKQKGYPNIRFDNSENDIIQLWQNGKDEYDLIQIKYENIDKLIEILNKLKNK